MHEVAHLRRLTAAVECVRNRLHRAIGGGDPLVLAQVATTRRRTTPGTARFDVRIATVAACPVLGGKLAGVDDTRAKAIRGDVV